MWHGATRSGVSTVAYSARRRFFYRRLFSLSFCHRCVQPYVLIEAISLFFYRLASTRNIFALLMKIRRLWKINSEIFQIWYVSPKYLSKSLEQISIIVVLVVEPRNLGLQRFHGQFSSFSAISSIPAPLDIFLCGRCWWIM